MEQDIFRSMAKAAGSIAGSVLDDVFLAFEASAECFAEIIYLRLAGLLCLFTLVLNLLFRIALLGVATRAATDHADTGADRRTFTGITGDGADQSTRCGAPDRSLGS